MELDSLIDTIAFGCKFSNKLIDVHAKEFSRMIRHHPRWNPAILSDKLDRLPRGQVPAGGLALAA